ncbi:MAG TPA: HK97 family phage prohead protease [Allosphingosinicella sp.]|jgi:hypothetical protein
MTNIEKRFYAMTSVEVRAKPAATEGETREGIAHGYAAVFNSDSEDLGCFVERIRPGAFAKSLSEGRNVYALWSHDVAMPLGSTASGKLKLEEDERGLRFELDTIRMTPAQLSALEDGDLRMSFGFSVREQLWAEHDDGTVERELIEVDLFEVSFVISPAYPETEAALRSLEAWQATRSDDTTPEAAANATARIERLKEVLAREIDRRLS